ncbi:MFS transporter [Streptomyces niveiscabiei]|uniref:MFS transporter n=1 Tax=Streptomyces niveiscabiei TaxID=164115 RepID=UPI0029B566B1|nr:MFS transporter [Streptomyces niveiscabiei]MDX3385557.1 MFS transporter [Streptomyces niveiscabiei]
MPSALLPLTGVLLAQLLAMLDTNVTATAMPVIIDEFGALDSFFWVATAYTLAATVTTPLYGKLGDLFGRKPVFVFAMAAFLTGSVLSGLAQSMPQLALFRAVQGVGAGGFIVSAMALYTELLTAEQRTRFQGWFSTALTGCAALGPLVGGYVTDGWGWRWIFHLNLPIGAVSLLLVLTTLEPAHRTSRPAVDYGGALLTGGVATGLVLVSAWAGTEHSWASPTILALTGGTILLAAALGVVERRVREPVVPLHLLRRPILAISNAQAFASGAAMFGALMFLPVFLQVTTGGSATDSGLLLLPLTLGIVLAALCASPLMVRFGHEKWFGAGGVAVTGLGLGLLVTLTPDTGRALAAGYTVLIGVGLGLMTQVYALAVMNNSPMRDLGAAVSLQTLSRQLGGSLGLAAFNAVFHAKLVSELSGLDAEQLRTAQQPESVHQLTGALRETALNAYDAAVDRVFLVAACVLAVALALALLLKLPDRSDEPGKEPAQA